MRAAIWIIVGALIVLPAHAEQGVGDYRGQTADLAAAATADDIAQLKSDRARLERYLADDYTHWRTRTARTGTRPSPSPMRSCRATRRRMLRSSRCARRGRMARCSAEWSMRRASIAASLTRCGRASSMYEPDAAVDGRSSSPRSIARGRANEPRGICDVVDSDPPRMRISANSVRTVIPKR